MLRTRVTVGIVPLEKKKHTHTHPTTEIGINHRKLSSTHKTNGLANDTSATHIGSKKLWARSTVRISRM